MGAIAWTQLLNPSVGYLNDIFRWMFNLQTAPFNIYTFGGIAWVLTLFYSPFAFITISRAMEKMDPTLEEAARISGAGPFRTLLNVTLPLMAPSILAGGLLVFIAAGSCFGIPAIVGMPGNVEVLTTRIVTYLYMGSDEGVRDSTALAASLMFIANGLLFFMTWMLGRKDFTTISGKSTRPNIVELGKWKWVAVAAITTYAAIAVVIPIGSIVMTSFLKSLSKSVLSLSNYGFDVGPVHGDDLELGPVRHHCGNHRYAFKFVRLVPGRQNNAARSDAAGPSDGCRRFDSLNRYCLGFDYHL